LQYRCIADFKVFESLGKLILERSREFAKPAITMPLFLNMTTDEQVEKICSILRGCVLSP